MKTCDEVTYWVTGFLYGGSRDKYPPKLVEERVNGFVVNVYTGYDRESYLDLDPRLKVMPSNVPFKRKKVGIHNTRRAY